MFLLCLLPGLEVGRPIARQPEAQEEGVARAEARRVLVASALSGKLTVTGLGAFCAPRGELSSFHNDLV